MCKLNNLTRSFCMNLYERIEALCKQRGINVTEMCRDTGLTRAKLSDLKMKRTRSLSAQALKTIAGYFCVSVDYLLGEEEPEPRPASEHTALIMASYLWWFNHPTLQSITLSADWRGTGSIYWNEANTRHQPFYSMLGAQATLRMKNYELTIWGRNLTDTRYNVFYFKSVGEEFYSEGAPIHGGVKLNIIF